MKALLIVDGGTTNLRVHLLDADSLEERSCARAEGGVRHTAIDGHNGRLKTLLRACIEEALEKAGLTAGDVVRCVAYGMITSGMGLLEIPHLVAPVSPEDLRAGMRAETFPEIAPFAIEFIPGVRNFSGTVTAESCPGMDMMRGEETEAVGLYRLLSPDGGAMFVLPGSHNKFVRMDAQGRIQGCMTSISGELLDAMTHHTILAGAVESSFCSAETYDAEMARAGAAECARSGLGRAAFAGRILNTLGGTPAAAVQSWLLGAALREDVRAMRAFMDGGQTPVFVSGKPPLQRAFMDVMEASGLTGAISVDPAVTARMGVRGALAIAGEAGE